MRAIMYCFGASEQDADGNPALKSKATLEAIKYVKALYDEAMTKDVLTWDAASNNRFMLNGEGSLTLDTVSIARASENMKLPIADDLRLAKVPRGPAGRLGPAFGGFHATSSGTSRRTSTAQSSSWWTTSGTRGKLSCERFSEHADLSGHGAGPGRHWSPTMPVQARRTSTRC